MSGFKQLCWTCRHACNSHECIWVETLDVAKCGELEFTFDSEGYITSCKNYESEKVYLSFITERAKCAGIPVYTYIRLVKQIKKYNLNITPEMLYQLESEDKAKYEEDKKECLNLGLSLSKFYSLYKYIKKLKLDISVADYYKKRQEQKEIIKNAKLSKKTVKKASLSQKSHNLGVSYGYYAALCNEIKKKGLNITPEELYAQKQSKKENTKSALAEKLGISYNYYYRIEQEIKKLGLNISVEEFYYNKRHYRNLVK